MRYLGFACSQFYPRGGMDDMIASGELLHEVIMRVVEYVRKTKEDSTNTFFHVFDCEAQYIIMRSSNIFELEDRRRVKVAPNCQVWSRKDNHWVIDANQS